MIAIRQEAEDIISGKQPKENNVLKNAPHPVSVIARSDAEWNRYVSALDTFVTLIVLLQAIFQRDCCIPTSLPPRTEVLAFNFKN
jgi:hypothetical protein